MKVVCQNPKCGKVFDVKPSIFAHGGGKHCSRACRFRRTPEERFWAKVRVGSKDECWLWLGSVNNDGYGQFGVAGKDVKAHRFSWKIHNGPIPEGLCVCHHCDVPRCVNPGHLVLWTHIENMADRGRKGRDNPRYGSAVGTAKLDEEKVHEIRRLYGRQGIGGLTLTELGNKYGVTPTTISFVINRRTWKEVI